MNRVRSVETLSLSLVWNTQCKNTQGVKWRRMNSWTLLENWRNFSDAYTNCNWCSWYSRRRINKGLEDLEIRERTETIQAIALLRTAEYWAESWRPEKTCFHSNFSERPLTNADVKNSQIIIIIIIIKDKYFDLAREYKNYGAWRWQLYQSRFVLLVQ